ncbi:hypothetical protein ABEF95_014957 [Exophiala dermatitidis]
MSSQPPQNAVDITTLSVQQLSALQARLSQELEHLTTSYQRLRAAQARFKDCIRSIQQGVQGKSGGTLAAPKSTDSSSSSSTVLVDIGTGFFVEKTPEDGIKFYTGKVDDLGKNLLEIEKAVGGKNESLRVVEDVLRQKMLAEQAAGSASTNQPRAQATVG